MDKKWPYDKPCVICGRPVTTSYTLSFLRANSYCEHDGRVTAATDPEVRHDVP